ncbi:hypothetical protein [Streptomyces sp. NPDC001089]
MPSENVSEPKSVGSAEAVSAKAVDDLLIDELVHRARAEGLHRGTRPLLPGSVVMSEDAIAARVLQAALTDVDTSDGPGVANLQFNFKRYSID